MNTLFLILVVLAVILGMANVGLLLVWFKGIGSLFFPFFRFLIAIPMTIVLTSTLQLAIVIVAAVVDRYRGSPTGIFIRSF